MFELHATFQDTGEFTLGLNRIALRATAFSAPILGLTGQIYLWYNSLCIPGGMNSLGR